MFVILSALLVAASGGNISGSPLRVATFNVQALCTRDSDARFALVAQMIAAAGFPHITAVQEIADDDGDLVTENTGAARTVQKLVQHIERQGGPAYRAHSVDPQAHRDGGPPGANIRTVVLTTLPADTPAVRLLWDDDIAFEATRKPLHVRLIYEGITLDVLAVHLSAGPIQKQKRRAQAQRLGTSVADFDSGHNTILLGDFNAEDREDLWPVVAQAGMVDTTAMPAVASHASGHRFDRILIGSAMRASDKAFVMPRTRASDHAMVWADVQITSAPMAREHGGCTFGRGTPRGTSLCAAALFVVLCLKRRCAAANKRCGRMQNRGGILPNDTKTLGRGLFGCGCRAVRWRMWRQWRQRERRWRRQGRHRRRGRQHHAAGGLSGSEDACRKVQSAQRQRAHANALVS